MIILLASKCYYPRCVYPLDILYFEKCEQQLRSNGSDYGSKVIVVTK